MYITDDAILGIQAAAKAMCDDTGFTYADSKGSGVAAVAFVGQVAAHDFAAFIRNHLGTHHTAQDIEVRTYDLDEGKAIVTITYPTDLNGKDSLGDSDEYWAGFKAGYKARRSF